MKFPDFAFGVNTCVFESFVNLEDFKTHSNTGRSSIGHELVSEMFVGTSLVATPTADHKISAITRSRQPCAKVSWTPTFKDSSKEVNFEIVLTRSALECIMWQFFFSLLFNSTSSSSQQRSNWT